MDIFTKLAPAVCCCELYLVGAQYVEIDYCIIFLK